MSGPGVAYPGGATLGQQDIDDREYVVAEIRTEDIAGLPRMVYSEYRGKWINLPEVFYGVV